MNNVKIIKTEVTPALIKFWSTNNLNVLLIGRHGIGKTAMVMGEWTEIYGPEGIRWKYLSTPTLDPWVDFVGIPTIGKTISFEEQMMKILALQDQIAKGDLDLAEAKKMLQASEDGDDSIRFIRPGWFDTAEAICLDEMGRAHPKVYNAVMEIIQLHSLNGKPLPKLKLVWGAMNPPDDDTFHYDVKPMDAATKDRFHLHIHVKETPSLDYFTKAFNLDIATAAVAWWGKQNADVQELISPRRLEMLVKHILLGGDPQHVVPEAVQHGATVGELQKDIRKNGPTISEMREIYRASDAERAAEFMSDESKWAIVKEAILDKGALKMFFLPHAPDERLAQLFSDNNGVQSMMLAEAMRVEKFKDILISIFSTTTDSVLRHRISSAIGLLKETGQIDATVNGEAGILIGNKSKKNSDLRACLSAISTENKTPRMQETHRRQAAFRKIQKNMPVNPLSDQAVRSLMDVLETCIIGRAHLVTLVRHDTPSGGWHGVLSCLNRAVKDLSTNGFDLSVLPQMYAKCWALALMQRDKFYMRILD